MRLSFALLLLACLCRTQVLAKSSDYLIDTWTADNNLPDSSVSSVIQSPDGYLWVGTYNGLARFDGVRFVTFDPANTPQLKHARVSGLFVDSRGTLWINTYDTSMTSLRDGVFAYEWTDAFVSEVYCSSNGTYLATLSGGVAMRPETTDHPKPWRTIQLARRNDANTYCQDANGVIWYTLREGLLGRISGTNAVPLPMQENLRAEKVNYVTADRAGCVWIGTDKKIARWDGSRFVDETPTNGEAEINAKYLFFTATNGYWAFVNGTIRHAVNRQWVSTINSWPELVNSYGIDMGALEARNGDIWFRQLGHGLYCIAADGKLSRLTGTNGLPGDRVTSFCEDREGNIWVGIDRGGLVRLRKKQFQLITDEEHRKRMNAFTVCEDARSNMWIGTVGDGLIRCDGGQQQTLSVPDGANPDSFYSAFPDSQGRLWLSCDREDLYTFADGKIVQDTNRIHGVKSIFVDRQGRIWLGRRLGLTSIADGVVTDYGPRNGLERGEVRAIAQDKDGTIWIGTGTGAIFRFSKGQFKSFKPTDAQPDQAIWSLLVQEDGTVWAGTFRGGLLRLKDGVFTRYTSAEGLPGNVICQILDDGLGRLWFGSHNGIFFVPMSSFERLDRKEAESLPCTAYGLSDGLPTLECSGGYQPSCWRDHEGKLWFTTGKGVAVVNPADVRMNPHTPPVLIEDFLLDGKRLKGAPARLAPDSVLTVAPGRHQFDFQFTALSFSAPEKIRFCYKLDGFENQWVDAGGKRVAHYGPLPPGDYQFQVIGCNNDGLWNLQGASVRLRQLPFFWQTWWFDLIAVLAAIAFLSAIVWYVATRELHRKLERLHEQRAIHSERERIAKDIHDDLGTGLTQILLQSSLAGREAQGGQIQNDLAQISETAHNLVRGMDEIVWAINPENDTLDGLVTYIGKFVQEFLMAAKLRCRLDLPRNLSGVPVSAETRHNVFLAVKETLNNVVKHSGASEVLLELKLESNAFVLRITDNGRGFTPGGNPSSASDRVSAGHGLLNLENRMKKLGGQCTIKSEAGKGTSVELFVPVKNHRVLD